MAEFSYCDFSVVFEQSKVLIKAQIALFLQSDLISLPNDEMLDWTIHTEGITTNCMFLK